MNKPIYFRNTALNSECTIVYHTVEGNTPQDWIAEPVADNLVEGHWGLVVTTKKTFEEFRDSSTSLLSLFGAEEKMHVKCVDDKKYEVTIRNTKHMCKLTQVGKRFKLEIE